MHVQLRPLTMKEFIISNDRAISNQTLFIFAPELFIVETTLWLYYTGAGARFNDFRFRAPTFSTTHPVKTSFPNKSVAINLVVFLSNCDKSHKEWKMIMHFYFIVFLRLKVAFSHLFELELNVLLIQTVCFLLFFVKPLKWFRSMRNKLTWALHTVWNNVKDVWKKVELNRFGVVWIFIEVSMRFWSLKVGRIVVWWSSTTLSGII